MKKWMEASVEELNIAQTEHGLFGNAADGGRFGDGIISGHSKWVFSSGDGGNKGDDDTKTEDSTGNGDTDLAS